MELAEIDKEILEIKRKALELGLAKEKMLHERKLEYFVPNPKQLDFFNHSNIKRRGGFCGNRFGKSTMGVVEDCSWLIGYRPFFPEGDIRRRQGIPVRGVKGLLIGEEWGKVKEIFTEDQNSDRPGKIIEFMPEKNSDNKYGIIKKSRHQTGALEMITVESELDGRVRQSVLFLETVQSFSKNARIAESSDWDFVHVDEPIPEDMWKAVSRGLIDRGGFAWWLLTPLFQPWMVHHMEELCAEKPHLYWSFEASMDDNPLLSEEDKELYLSQLTLEEQECRRLGKSLAAGRLVYGQYSEKLHLWNKPEPPEGWKDWATPPADHMIAYALDPHPQTPDACLFIAVAPTGAVYVFDEFFERGTFKETANRILTRRNRVSNFQYELADPWIWQENRETKRSWVDELWTEGLRLVQGSKEKNAGIIEVNNLLGSPREFWVFPHLTRFRKEIKTWFFDKENKPIDKDDHMMECFRRLVQFDRLRYHAPPTKSPKKLVSKDPFSTIEYKITGDDGNYSC